MRLSHPEARAPMETLLRRVSVVLFLLSGLFLVFTYYTTLPNLREEYCALNAQIVLFALALIRHPSN